MSDSGRQMGDCRHARTPSFCVDCLQEQVAYLTENLANADREILRLTALVDDGEVAAQERDAYRRDLEDIGRILGCDHVHDGMARCVRSVVQGSAT